MKGPSINSIVAIIAIIILYGLMGCVEAKAGSKKYIGKTLTRSTKGHQVIVEKPLVEPVVEEKPVIEEEPVVEPEIIKDPIPEKEPEVKEEIIPEPTGGAHRDPQKAAGFLKEVVNRHLDELMQLNPEELREQRYQKYRSVGVFNEQQATVSQADETIEQDGTV